MNIHSAGRISAYLILTATVAVGLAACVAGPAPRPVRVPVEPAAIQEPPISQQVLVYPGNGQSEAQLDRDRYECNSWAVRQSSFDPSVPQLPSHERVQVVSMAPPAGTNTVAGAATGAIIGAAVSSPRASGGGALLGAVAGAFLGASADASNEQRAEAIQQRYDQRDLQAQARIEQHAHDYRRAITACLEARGYTVK